MSDMYCVYNGKKYKIKSDRSDTDDLEITVKGISK